MSAISDLSPGEPAKASDLMVEALEREGVEYVFGIPGEENLDILESLRHSKIQLVLTRHEQGAGFMAATIGRLTGKLGVCLSTLGPGATNFVTAAAYAQLGAMPMMMITGQKPIKKTPCTLGHPPSMQTFQNMLVRMCLCVYGTGAMHLLRAGWSSESRGRQPS